MVQQGRHIITNTLKHSTSSHKWWERLLWCERFFGVKPYITAPRGPGGGLVVAPSEKASLLGSV